MNKIDTSEVDKLIKKALTPPAPSQQAPPAAAAPPGSAPPGAAPAPPPPGVGGGAPSDIAGAMGAGAPPGGAPAGGGPENISVPPGYALISTDELNNLTDDGEGEDSTEGKGEKTSRELTQRVKELEVKVEQLVQTLQGVLGPMPGMGEGEGEQGEQGEQAEQPPRMAGPIPPGAGMPIVQGPGGGGGAPAGGGGAQEGSVVPQIPTEGASGDAQSTMKLIQDLTGGQAR